MSGNTKQFSIVNENEQEIKRVIKDICAAMLEKGYDPISQIVGYILSDDPTYITTHNNARNLIRRIDRFELLHILLRDYLSTDKDK